MFWLLITSLTSSLAPCSKQTPSYPFKPLNLIFFFSFPAWNGLLLDIGWLSPQFLQIFLNCHILSEAFPTRKHSHPHPKGTVQLPHPTLQLPFFASFFLVFITNTFLISLIYCQSLPLASKPLKQCQAYNMLNKFLLNEKKNKLFQSHPFAYRIVMMTTIEIQGRWGV